MTKTASPSAMTLWLGGDDKPHRDRVLEAACRAAWRTSETYVVRKRGSTARDWSELSPDLQRHFRATISAALSASNFDFIE